MEKEKQIAEKKYSEAFVLKASIPLADGAFLKDWNDSCQAELPLGFKDYRWGKMLYDHLFVRNFGQALDDMRTELKSLSAEVHMLREELKKKEESSGTFH